MGISRVHILLVCTWVLLAVAGQGCGGPTFIVQQYSGAARPAEAVAVIRIHGTDPFFLYSVDGEQTSARVPEDARIHIEVLPGKHTVEIVSAHNTSQLPQMASFRAEAGKVYRPALAQPGQSSEADYRAGLAAARVYEVDAGNDAPIRDVTLADRHQTEVSAPSHGGSGHASKKPLQPPAPEEGAPADAGSAEPADASPP